MYRLSGAAGDLCGVPQKPVSAPQDRSAGSLTLASPALFFGGMMTKTLVIDLDGTLTVDGSTVIAKGAIAY
jgi:hypothetical protein